MIIFVSLGLSYTLNLSSVGTLRDIKMLNNILSGS